MTDNKHIGISEMRMNHILGVARKCYVIAKEQGYDEDKCRRMFMLGYVHDVGYEFSNERDEHALISAQLLQTVGTIGRDCIIAILHHGSMVEKIEQSDEWRILVTADMTTDSNGREVTAEERLLGIKKRYGAESRQYINSANVCRYLNLIN